MVLKRMMMAALLSSTVFSAMAADWKLIYEGAGYRAELDMESLSRSNHIVRAWDRLIPPGGIAADEDGFSYRYIMTWSDYDCAARRVTAFRRIYVGESPREIKEQNPIRYPVVNVAAGTPRERLWATACQVNLNKAKSADNTNQKNADTAKSNANKVDDAAKQPQTQPNRKATKPYQRTNSSLEKTARSANKQESHTQTKPTSKEKFPIASEGNKETGNVPENNPVKAEAKPSTTAPIPKSNDSKKQSDSLSEYLQNQLKEGRSGELIIMTSTK